MLSATAQALAQIDADRSVRCLLLTGTGRGFCAGQDLNERRETGPDAMPDLAASLDEKYNPVIRALTTLHAPVVCAVNGLAAGAGASLALACDIVLAARSAAFIQAFSRIGLVPDAGQHLASSQAGGTCPGDGVDAARREAGCGAG